MCDFDYRGSIGERMNVRYFLSIGMVMAGIFSFLFGVAHWTNIHAYGYFIAVQVEFKSFSRQICILNLKSLIFQL